MSMPQRRGLPAAHGTQGTQGTRSADDEGTSRLRRGLLCRAGGALACLLAPPAAWAQAPSAPPLPAPLLTRSDGDAVVTQGAQRLLATPGLRLAAGSLLDTTARTTVLRIEWPDQSLIDLGPDTRAMLLPPGFRPRGGRPPALYLLQGWAKLTAAPGGVPLGAVLMPGLELLPVAGAVVLFAGPREHQVFAETGTVDLVTRPAGSQQGVASGGLYTGEGSVAVRPPAAWMQRVPRAFRDPIPRRADSFAGQNINAPVLPPPSYADLSEWLAAEPEVRREFPQRFAALAADPSFRRALQARLPAHPEWAALLRNPNTK